MRLPSSYCRPQYFPVVIHFGSHGLGHSSGIRHQSQLTTRACEKAVQELGKGCLRPMLISSFFSLKQLGVLLLAKGGMIVHYMANHSFKFDGTNNDNSFITGNIPRSFTDEAHWCRLLTTVIQWFIFSWTHQWPQ